MIYVIGEQSTGIVKIGYSAEPVKRLKEIQAGNHRPLQVLLAVPGDRGTERTLHQHFAGRCVGGEWFDFGKDDAPLLVLQASLAPKLPDRAPAAQPRPSKPLPWDVVELMCFPLPSWEAID